MLSPRCTYIIATQTRGKGRYWTSSGEDATRLDGNHVHQRSFYVPVTRGKEQAVIFTDSKEELLKVVQRPDEPLSVTELSQVGQRKPSLGYKLRHGLAFGRGTGVFSGRREVIPPRVLKTPTIERGVDHDR
jgi:hypothetical protein